MFLSCLVFGAALSSLTATGQDLATTAQASNNAPCQFGFAPSTAGAPQILYAGCGGRGVILGPATTYRVLVNPKLQATLVDIHSGTARRILMISVREDGQPIVEDISGAISTQAGKGPMSPIDGVDVDLEHFSDDGAIGVSRASQAGGASPERKIIDLAQHMNSARTSTTGAPNQN